MQREITPRDIAVLYRRLILQLEANIEAISGAISLAENYRVPARDLQQFIDEKEQAEARLAKVLGEYEQFCQMYPPNSKEAPDA